MTARLTTTSYAVLAQVAVRPWSTYELVQQRVRYFRYVWPRAESAIYREVKRLSSMGLLEVKKEHVGKRARTVYSITEKGREALREWLATPVVPENYVHGYQAYVCLFRPEEPTMENVNLLTERRNALMAELERRGVATRQGTHSPILTGFYARRYDLRPNDFARSVLADRLSLALPLYPQMTDEEQETVVTELRAVFDALA